VFFFQTWASSSFRNVFDSVMLALTTATSQFSSPQPCSSEIQYHPNTEQVSDNSLDDSTDRWDASSHSSDCEITSGKYLESFIKRCFVVTECIIYYFEIHQNHLIHFHACANEYTDRATSSMVFDALSSSSYEPIAKRTRSACRAHSL